MFNVFSNIHKFEDISIGSYRLLIFVVIHFPMFMLLLIFGIIVWSMLGNSFNSLSIFLLHIYCFVLDIFFIYFIYFYR